MAAARELGRREGARLLGRHPPRRAEEGAQRLLGGEMRRCMLDIVRMSLKMPYTFHAVSNSVVYTPYGVSFTFFALF